MIGRTRWQTLLVVSLGVGVVTFGFAQWWVGRGGAPLPISPAVALVLLAVSAVLYGLGRSVRRFVQGKRAPMDPLRAFRILVLAKASALAGAAQVGFYGALAAVVLGLPEAPEAQAQAWSTGAAAVASLALVVVALVVEWFCRVPPVDPEPAGRGGTT